MHSPRVLLLAILPLLAAPAAPAAGDAPPSRPAPAKAEDKLASARKALDTYLDTRWDAPADATEALVKTLSAAGLDAAGVEKLLREGRAAIGDPPQARGKITPVPRLDCDHVDYSTVYFIYVPKGYDPAKPCPLVIEGHGGNSAMPREYCAQAALGGMHPFWTAQAEEKGFIVAAPLSERGWGAIGNSVILSLISKLQRQYRIDPDRIYVTGHSMGGHLSWRSGIYLPDRWGAVGPMSGGYDYVKSKEVYNLFNVPGFATYGAEEPYEINTFNNTIKGWMEEHGYPWVMREMEGGHTIFPETLPEMAKFFLEHPRDLYRERVLARGAGKLQYDTADKNERWQMEHTWTAGRTIPSGTCHWIRLLPLPEDTPQEKAFQEAFAENKGGNLIEITSRNVRKLRIYLHPKRVDLAKPVRVTANGKIVFEGVARPDLKTMLELVREFDDRGRVFHAAVDVAIETDADIPEPSFKK